MKNIYVVIALWSLGHTIVAMNPLGRMQQLTTTHPNGQIMLNSSMPPAERTYAMNHNAQATAGQTQLPASMASITPYQLEMLAGRPVNLAAYETALREAGIPASGIQRYLLDAKIHNKKYGC